MGQLIKSKRFWTASQAAAVLALLIWFSSWAPSHLTTWLSAKKTEELYVDLHWAIWAVIIGVIIEEIKLLRHVIKFISHAFAGRFGEACTKAWKHKDELFEGIGFAILVGGLLFELEISRFIETAQKAELEDQKALTRIAIGQTETLAGLVTRLGSVVADDQIKILEQMASEKKFANENITDLKETAQRFNKANAVAQESAKRVEAALTAASAKEKELTAAVTTINELHQQLHDLTTDRTIDVDRVAGKLRIFGKIPFDFIVADDHDSESLTSQISTALEKAGWDWKPWEASDKSLHIGKNIPGKPFMLTGNSVGVLILISASDRPALGKAAEALIGALNDEDLKRVSGAAISDDEMKKSPQKFGLIHIFVGSKQ